jgi:uncharacterized protein YybS (DUF2232 family)
MGPFIGLLMPLPFLYYTTKLGLTPGLKLLALTLLAIALFGQWAGHSQGLLFAVQFSLLGVFLSILFRKGFGPGQTVVLATGFLLVLSLAFLGYVALQKDVGPWELIRRYLGENLDAGLRPDEGAGASPENAMAFRQFRETLTQVLFTIFPALMVVGTGFAVWLNMVLALRLFRVTQLEVPEYFHLERWWAPEHLVWVLLASGFALFLTSGGIQFVAINVLIIVMAVYMFHGLSIVVFFLEKYHAPSWMRIGLYILIAVQQLFLVVLALAGLFDQWIDFRKIRRQSTDLGAGGE